MKPWGFTVSLLIILPLYLSANTRDLVGYWTNQQYQLELRVEETRQGIRVQRTDRSRWHTYRQIRADQYRDAEGNTYYFTSRGTLEWESHDGRKRIQFRRDARSNTPRYRSNDRRSRPPVRRVITSRDLHGTWLDRWSDDCLVIRARRDSLRVRGIGWGNRSFYLTRNGFQDHKGNLLRLQGHRLQWINRRGRLVGEYVRR